MYDATVSPYGGLVLIVATTGFVVNVFNCVNQDEGWVI